jgi:tRNA 2-thiouridine synthesizing protein A
MKLIRKGEGIFELDVRGYVCPHPQLYTMKSLEKLKPGSILEVVFDNPSSNETITMACKKKGYKILERAAKNGIFKLKIRRD